MVSLRGLEYVPGALNSKLAQISHCEMDFFFIRTCVIRCAKRTATIAVSRYPKQSRNLLRRLLRVSDRKPDGRVDSYCLQASNREFQSPGRRITFIRRGCFINSSVIRWSYVRGSGEESMYLVYLANILIFCYVCESVSRKLIM